ALFRLVVDMELVTGAALVAVVFLGGFALPPVYLGGLDVSNVLAVVLFLVKTLLVIGLLSALRACVGRLRIDQVVDFSWRWLAPLALVQILISIAARVLLGL
ncbi:MAG: NADH-quinone oxidoreductase subunit H, partial [candidate division WOR-3 bacterium]